MNLVRSILFALFFYPGTVLAVLLTLPAAAIGPRWLVRVAHLWAQWQGWCARVLLGVRVRIEGSPPEGPVLVAAKHQSMFETLELVLLLNEPAAIIKKELGDIPLWGWAAQRYGMIAIDRAGGATALRRMLRVAEKAVAAGRSIMIFPEGTRVAPGEQPPLQSGFAGLYRALGLPVVPVALDSGKVWGRNSFVKRPGIVTFRFGEPIPPGLKREEIEARVYAEINALEPASAPTPRADG